jgi:hypothetical protein
VIEPTRQHRLNGLEPDNLLAFLALLGLLRALEAARPALRPRASWDLENAPLRPILTLAEAVMSEAICAGAADGIAKLVALHNFGDAADLKLDTSTARSLCVNATESAALDGHYFADLCAALICDAAVDQDQARVEPTPLAYPSVATSNFLKNLKALSESARPEKRRDPSYPKDAAACIAQALFEPWKRLDRPVGLRWDPYEAKRHAYQWRAPTKDLPTTQHGANRLAIIGLSLLTGAPAQTAARVTLSVIGGAGAGDRFSLAWPVWAQPASLAATRALLSHPRLRDPQALDYLGVDHVRVTRRISLDKFRNFTYARSLGEE